MRTLMIAGLAMVTAIAVTPAESQRLNPAPRAPAQVAMGGGQVNGGGHWSGGGQMGGGQWSGGQAMPRPPMNGGMPHNPGANYPTPPAHQPPMMPPGGGHWNNGGGQWSGGSNGGHWSGGGSSNGHWSGGHTGGGVWSGGTTAPGGWNAYHRPSRGWSLPRYWIAPSFYISDYGSYGLSVPPAGYGWSRYYDDAVLIDGRGRVADVSYGVDWDGYGLGGEAYAGDGYAYAQGGAGGQVSYGQSYYAADEQAYVEQAPQPAPPARVIYRDGGQQGSYTNSYSSSGGYVANGYYFPPAATTVVTIQSAPVVTTTTTEYVETYRTARRVYRPAPRPVRHRVVRRSCTCACGCR